MTVEADVRGGVGRNSSSAYQPVGIKTLVYEVEVGWGTLFQSRSYVLASMAYDRFETLAVLRCRAGHEGGGHQTAWPVLADAFWRY